MAHEITVHSSSVVETPYGVFRLLAFSSGLESPVHLALHGGDIAGDDVVVRVHSECLTGDVLGSLKCDCGEQLKRSLQHIGASGSGVIVYLRGHEGRGIGLNAKLRAYGLQEEGWDTIDANLMLGLPADDRDYSPAAAILVYLGVRSVRLITNNRDKTARLEDAGLVCRQNVPIAATVNRHNQRYLRTKKARLGHRGVLAAGG